MTYLRMPFCSPYKLFWPLVVRSNQAGDEIHRAYAGYVWRMHALQALPVALFYGIVWPIPFAWLSLKHTVRLGGTVKAATGKGRLRQIAEQFWVAFRHSISPKKYYVFELFRPERFRNAGQYIARYEFKGGLHNLLESRIESPTRRILNDKVAFYRHCQEHGLPTVPTFLMVAKDGTRARMADFQGQLPKCDLFVKPVRGRGGRGCERWQWRGEIGYVDRHGTILPERQVLGHLNRSAAKGAVLVQAALQVHEELRDLAMNVLTSCRIMTVRNERGGFEATHAVFKSSTQPDAIVDNFHRGGIVSRVDIKTGSLGPASDAGVGRPCVWYDSHPLTDAPITGRRLPMWGEVIDVVCRAHAAFPDRVTVGWDVSITDAGPVILEGNVQSGCDMIQRTHDLPAGIGRLAECYAFHTRQALKRDMSGAFRIRMANSIRRRRARRAARLGLTGIAANQIKHFIASKVTSGEWSAGFVLPCEHDLGSEFGVSNQMIGRCLNDLARDGLLRRGMENWQVARR